MRIMKKAIYALLIVAILLSMFVTIVKAAGTTLKVTADTLNLREKASTSSDILTLLSKDDECELINEDGDWYKVKYESYTGYVSKEYVKKVETSNEQPKETTEGKDETTDKEEQNTVETENAVEDTKVEKETTVTGKISKKTKARILPLINSSELKTLAKGTNVEIISKVNGWTYVIAEEISAWVRNDCIEGEKTETKPVENEDNNLDNKQDENKDDNVDDLDENTTSKEDNKEDNTTSNTFEEKTMYVNDSYVNLRKKASTSSDVLMVVALNTKLTVIGEEGEWYKVKTSEGEAYISKKLLSDEKTSTTSRGTSVVRGATENINAENLENPEKSSTETKKTEEVTEDSSKKDTLSESNKKAEKTSSKGAEIVAYAKKFLGVPYVYGGASTRGFDCSGFTMYVYNKFGISMRHGAQAQAKLGTAVNADKSSASSLKNNLKPGDLVFFLDYETMDEIGHCGIYIGDGNFIHASSGSGYCVKINSLLPGEYYNTRYCAARRII